MRTLRPADYGPVLGPLVDVDRLRPIDAGQPDEASRAALESATLPAAFAHARAVDADMARCCLAGLWLLHDFLDESHAISQQIDAPSGSFWHGVMHRREGDYSNAKYWFRRTGRHETLAELGRCLGQLAGDSQPLAARCLGPSATFDPEAFVDACREAKAAGGDADFCRRIQQAEWELLFDYCYRHAIGDD